MFYEQIKSSADRSFQEEMANVLLGNKSHIPLFSSLATSIAQAIYHQKKMQSTLSHLISKAEYEKGQTEKQLLFEEAYKLLYSYVGVVPNSQVGSWERIIYNKETEILGNNQVHHRVWNSAKELVHVKNALFEVPEAEIINSDTGKLITCNCIIIPEPLKRRQKR